MSVITLITAQNSHSIPVIEILNNNIIEKQIEALFSDYNISAVKIGALGNDEVIKLIIKSIKKWNMKNIILDPVMISKSKVKLFNNNSFMLFNELIKCVDLITPNIDEAKLLVNTEINNPKELLNLLIKQYPKTNILLKGGHMQTGNIIDILYFKENIYEFKHQRINTENTHGTGCTLSSAIAANVANRLSILDAVKEAINYTYKAIKNNLNYGKIHGPLDHFFNQKGEF